ncbi:MAG TPA: hypothetical protein ENN08_07015 [Bacteroidales bacterium]|nr:hypothetical protein [Bacteroidales bacterium]
MEISNLQWIGYIASVIIAISMTMNSILKFRWINLAGAATFATYGYLIGALPVGLLNTFIVGVDIYYLVSIYSKKDIFQTLEVRPENRYLIRFLDFHKHDIQRFFPGFSYKPEMNTMSVFTLRNMAVAGVFLAHRIEGNILKVGLDYVLPDYRDFKNGRFIYGQLDGKLKNEGFKKVISKSGNKKHSAYLRKLGFTLTSDGFYEKELGS